MHNPESVLEMHKIPEYIETQRDHRVIINKKKKKKKKKKKERKKKKKEKKRELAVKWILPSRRTTE